MKFLVAGSVLNDSQELFLACKTKNTASALEPIALEFRGVANNVESLQLESIIPSLSFKTD